MKDIQVGKVQHEKKTGHTIHGPQSVLTLVVELVLTVCVFAAVVTTAISTIGNEAYEYTANIESDYQSLTNRYLSVFRAMTIPIKEMVDADPSFEEMGSWLQAHESSFSEAVGSNIYDGFAMTYKGGYAHSWNYGDYTDYDPNTRIWYQEAQRANGDITVVAPYVTYLGPQYPNSDQYIEMTIAQKYTDEVSFDLDLKIYEINALLTNRTSGYKGTEALLFDKNGFILSSTDTSLYCHNINNPDEALSEQMSGQLLSLEDSTGKLQLFRMDGALKAVYSLQDDDGNIYCVMIPFESLFMQNFLVVGIVMVLLILLEILIYRWTQKTIVEMSARDNRITEIARAAFQNQFYVDVNTMRFTSEGQAFGNVATDDYRELFRYLLSIAPDGVTQESLKDFLSPAMLDTPGKSGLVSNRFALEMPREDGSKERVVFDISRFVSKMNRKSMAVILINDVTAKEKGQQEILESIAHHYLDVLVGNILSQQIDIIKSGSRFESFYTPALTARELHQRFASMYLKDEYRDSYLSAMSFETIKKNLATSDGYSITVELKDGHWLTIRVIRCIGYLENHRFALFVENADEQMSRQGELSRALDEANAADRAKSDFLSRISHDIRTPLNGIIGMTHLASRESNPSKTQDCLAKIDTSSKFLLGLVNDVLDMSKAESEEMELNLEPYSLEDFNSYLDAVIRPLCAEKHQTLQVDIQPVGGVSLFVDTLKFNQIFFNLLSNSVKYTPEGGTIVLRMRNSSKEDGRLAMYAEVSDTGKGISAEFQKAIFDPFTQEGRSDISESRGSGLGLAIVKKLVELMDGTISVESEVGKGSTFKVNLNVDITSTGQSDREGTESAADEDLGVLIGRHVLLCDDHPLNQEIAKALLCERGMIVEIADNGQKSIDLFKMSAIGFYDVILMDIRMPVMDGYQATMTIRSMERSDAKTVPIIAMTADAFEEDVRKCLDAGMNGHLAKPIDAEAMYGTLVRAIGGDL